MALTVKVLLTLTVAVIVFRAWIVAAGIAGAGVAARASGKLNSEADRKVRDLTGKSTLKAIGATLWLVPLAVLLWTSV